MATTHNDVPLWMKILAGGVAGSTETIITYPLDVIKTRQQLSKGQQGILSTGREILSLNGLPAFYRGMTSPVIGEFVKRGVKFGCNEQYKALFSKTDPITKMETISNLGSAGAGALAGITEAFFNCPFEVVKVRMQAKENHGVYRSTWDCMIKILQQEGIVKGLYLGIEAQLWRNTVWNSVYFGMIGTIKNTMTPTTTADKTPAITPEQIANKKRNIMITSMIAGFIGGTLASCANISFDVAKSRIQNQLPNTIHKYKWCIPTLITINNEEGFKALFKGLGSKVARLSVGGSIMSLIFDLTLEKLTELHCKKKPNAKVINHI